MKYFQNYPKINYKGIETVDMTVRFKLVDSILKNHNSYYNYYWQDSDRIDVVAAKYYGDPNLSWLVMMSGEIYDWIYDLPLNNVDFHDYMKRKYDISIDEAKSTVHHYEDTISGLEIDKRTFDNTHELQRASVSVYQFEHDINEKRRHVKLVSKALVPDIIKEFDTRLQEIKNNRRLANYDNA